MRIDRAALACLILYLSLAGLLLAAMFLAWLWLDFGALRGR